MIYSTAINETREIVKEWYRKGLSIGFIPTMGYLHQGHLSLIERARKENDRVIVSIFVNPTQFGPNEDYEKYPRDIESDLKMCRNAGTDLVFAPEVLEMYPVPNLAYVDIKELGNGLCGASRPGHFRGVCTIVSKLFNIVKPSKAYFGEKDIQQLTIIKRMVQDLNFDIDIVPCPIVRENDGLAMSSRNTYLSDEERKAALAISRSLNHARDAMNKGERDAENIKSIVVGKLSREPLISIDYVEVVDALTLIPAKSIKGKVIVAIAAFAGKTRLIDNLIYCEG